MITIINKRLFFNEFHFEVVAAVYYIYAVATALRVASVLLFDVYLPLGGFLLLRRRMMQMAMTAAAAINTTMTTTAMIAVELLDAVYQHITHQSHRSIPHHGTVFGPSHLKVADLSYRRFRRSLKTSSVWKVEPWHSVNYFNRAL